MKVFNRIGLFFLVGSILLFIGYFVIQFFHVKKMNKETSEGMARARQAKKDKGENLLNDEKTNQDPDTQGDKIDP